MQFIRVFLRIQTKYFSQSLNAETTTGSFLEEQKTGFKKKNNELIGRGDSLNIVIY